MQKLYHEQAERMLLANLSRLMGTPGRQVGYAMAKSMHEALKIAITVDQAARRNEAFYLDMEGR
jgi:hypothetical protein